MAPLLQLMQAYVLQLVQTSSLLDPNPLSLDVHYLCAVESCSLCRLKTGRNAIYDALKSRGGYAAKNLNLCKWSKRKVKRLAEDLDV